MVGTNNQNKQWTNIIGEIAYHDVPRLVCLTTIGMQKATKNTWTTSVGFCLHLGQKPASRRVLSPTAGGRLLQGGPGPSHRVRGIGPGDGERPLRCILLTRVSELQEQDPNVDPGSQLPPMGIRAVGNGIHFCDTTERASQRLFSSYKGGFPCITEVGRNPLIPQPCMLWLQKKVFLQPPATYGEKNLAKNSEVKMDSLCFKIKVGSRQKCHPFDLPPKELSLLLLMRLSVQPWGKFVLVGEQIVCPKKPKPKDEKPNFTPV